MNPIGLRARRAWALLAALLLFGAVTPASAETPTGGASAMRSIAAITDPGVWRDERPTSAALPGTRLAAGPTTELSVVHRVEARLEAQLAARDAVLERLAAEAAREAAAAGAAAAAKAAAAASAAAPRPSLVLNHLWIPSLGMSQPIYLFPCSRSTPPGNYLYRWGCAGRNNLYLLGHAYSVMKPLQDAYVAGRLRVGMLAAYADANGRITRYSVTAWQVVTPDVVAWAIASQPVPSMTLQTCVGTWSQYRLDVRLVSVP
jgi:sortase (surface protein transpeptidase)